MCWQMAAQMGAQAGMQAIQGNNAALANNEALRQNSWETVRTMNYEDANLRLKEATLLDKVRDDKTNLNLDAIQASGAVRAAIGEGLAQGRSMDRVQRDQEGQYVRASAQMTENYQRDYAAIFGNRVSNIEENKRQIEHNNANEQEVRSPLDIALDPLNIGIGKALIKGMNKAPGGKALNKGYNTALSFGKANDGYGAK